MVNPVKINSYAAYVVARAAFDNAKSRETAAELLRRACAARGRHHLNESDLALICYGIADWLCERINP